MKKICMIFLLLFHIAFGNNFSIGHFDSICDINKVKIKNLTVTLGKDDRILLWNLLEKKIIKEIDITEFGGGYLSCIAVSKDGSKIAAGSELGDIYIYEPEINRMTYSFKELHNGQVTGIRFVQNDRKIVTSSYDGKINLIDISTKILKKQFKLEEKVTALNITSNENEIVAGTDKGSLYFLDAKTLKITKSIPTIHSNWITGISFSKNEKMVATVGWDYKLHITSMTTKLPITSKYITKNKALNSVDWSQEGSIAVASSDGRIYLIKYDQTKKRKERLQILDSITVHDKQVNKAIFINMGKTLISGGSDYNLVVWDVVNSAIVDVYNGF